METEILGWVEGVARVIEVMGVAVIAIGGVAATLAFLLRIVRSATDFSEAYTGYRRDLGRAILLGLEFLVAGDIIATILVEPTLQKAAALGVIVLIRTFLSFSLETEIEGRLPWKTAQTEGAGQI